MSKTLLLADDSVTIQKVVGISFASEDVTLIAVDNGDDAITRAREELPDAILADVVMPGKNGYEVCEAIKADPALAHIPVLLLTGTFEAFDAERAERVGAAGHIAKPFESQTLVELVTSLFASSHAPAISPAAPAAAALEPTLDVPTVTQPIPTAAPAVDAFDFFDDDLEAPDVAAGSAPLAAAESLDVASESAFEFGEADLAPVAESPEPLGDLAGSAAGAPIAAMPAPTGDLEPVEPRRDDVFDLDTSHDLAQELDPELSQNTGPDLALDTQLEIDSGLGQPMSPDDGFDASTASTAFDENPAPGDSLSPLDSSNSAEDPFDFAFEPAPIEASNPLGVVDTEMIRELNVDDLAQATTVFPEEGPELDAPSSDGGPVGDPVGVGVSDQTVLLGLDASRNTTDGVLEPEAIGDGVAESSGFASDSPEAETVVTAEFTDLAATDPVPRVSQELVASPEIPQTSPESTHAPTVEPATDDECDLEIGSRPGSTADSLAAPATSASQPSAADMAAVRADDVLARIEPHLREQIHDTLEKIAWDSFGDLTATLVRQSVEKVEEIAWEVVPQLIETLVREEIRKLKGEPPSDE